MDGIFGFLAIIFGALAVIVGLIAGPAYYSACRQADIFNGLNHTQYTCGDFFWAADQINSQSQTVHLQEQKP
jgi:hypothetical protein